MARFVPLVFVKETPETKPEQTRKNTNRQDLPGWLLNLAEIASSRNSGPKESFDNQLVRKLGTPEPIVQTIYVPIFANDTPRRGPEIDLTRKVIQGIETRTPLKIAFSREGADSEVQGRLFYQEKKSKPEKSKKKNPPPPVLMLKMEWRDLNHGKILARNCFAGMNLRNMKKGYFMVLDDWTLGEMAKKVVDVIVKEGGKINWLQP